MVVIDFPDLNSSIPTNAIKEIIQAALEAADPYELVKQNMHIKNNSLRIGDKSIKLTDKSRIILLGLGKASTKMIQAGVDSLGDRIERGVCVCKHMPDDLHLDKIEIAAAGHPVPDERSEQAGIKLHKAVEGLTEDDLVILLLSGGGSALACLSVTGVRLEDIQEVTKFLLKNGATINEMNTVRKHLDLIKGGGLLKMASPAQMAVLVLSDVVGSPLDVIASGPAIVDPTTFEDALEILRRYTIPGQVAQGIIDNFMAGAEKEKINEMEDASQIRHSAYHKVIGSNVISVDAAARKAATLGFATKILTYAFTGEARLAGEQLIREAEYGTLRPPFVIFAGGETTVHVNGVGLGGRNLEVALGVVKRISTLKGITLVTLATDGEDGPTDAAGAIVTPETYALAGSDDDYLQECLDNNDSYTYFQKTHSLIKTGPTGTNVNDITFLIGY